MTKIKIMIARCNVCAETKPRFYKPPPRCLIKATQPFGRLSIDFKCLLPSMSPNLYIPTIIVDYSRFPFAFACLNMHSFIGCFSQLFTIFGTPSHIYSDCWTISMSTELSDYLRNRGVALSHTISYNLEGNGQIECHLPCPRSQKPSPFTMGGSSLCRFAFHLPVM